VGPDDELVGLPELSWHNDECLDAYRNRERFRKPT
jgi:hypothetical protein